MNLVSVSNLSKRVRDKVLFENLSFGLNQGEKLGIVGVNGSGKSTLLKILCGLEESDSGEVVLNRECKISYLSQITNFDPNKTILENILWSEQQKIKLVREYEKICGELETNKSSKLEEKYSQLISEMDRLNAWEVESQFRSLLKEFGIPNMNLLMKEISGGMQKKVELAKVLLDESNLLILDEPTNHLDIHTILWLESYLTNMNKALILITHDRYFLDSVVDKILELHNSKYFIYEGGYETYLQLKSARESLERQREAKERNFLKKELEWLGRQPKARGTKQQARIDRIQSVLQRDRTEIQKEIELSVIQKRQGKTILELHEISKTLGDKKLINDFSYTFKKSERMGIVGANGSGKTTFLNLITGRTPLDSGYIKVGMNTSFGYFEQKGIEIQTDQKVIDYIKYHHGEYIQTEEGKISASQLLERFLFTPAMQYSSVQQLSGGERRRLQLVGILMKNPNFLILDEPTNDLDIFTLSVLEDFLIQFHGCVVVVSHDRYFMDRVAESLLVFEGNGNIETHVGLYSEYLEKSLKENKKTKTKEEEISQKTEKQFTKSKTSYKTQKLISEIEKEIENLEKRKNQVLQLLQTHSHDFIKLKEFSEEVNRIEIELEKKYREWESLSSI
ncbi:MAG: ABC-F family ATP-binding cassette domain-containing protein [Leptospiraceae bacterium]|nr:ABC-F family ATP-binding cassette domain-containing protein [Leptospiraceae bacterium]